MATSRAAQRRGVYVSTALQVLALLLLPGTSGRAQEAGGRFYALSGHTLAAAFLSYFDRYGGLDLFGLPLTEARLEGGFLVQYFERQRFELHPELPEPYRVSLGLLGREQTRLRLRELPFQNAAPSANARYFVESQHNLRAAFREYWGQRGGLPIFGYPISEEYQAGGYVVQWFERARFELHPELPPAYRVTLGQLGRDALPFAGGLNATVQIGGPASPRRLNLGFSQGGESYDPRFFNNVIERSRPLAPRLIRLDNIYNHYNVINTGPDGRIVYNWTGLDALVDAIRAMGAEPMIALSYMPVVLGKSAAGDGLNVSPPASYAAWEQVVYDTVLHFNIERNTPIRYWEVWNEPDLPGFWRGTFEDYFQLYDASYRGAIAADPAIKLGGPALSNFIPGMLDQFLYHCVATGARLDFLDWHAYGKSSPEVQAQIAEARRLVGKYPQLKSVELMISEWNVTSGGPDDTSLGGQSDSAAGAAHALSTLDGMERAGLDWSLLFELKDGYRDGKAYWGRWGVMTEGGSRKPIYHAVAAYQSLGSNRLAASSDNPAAGAVTADGSTILVWLTGTRAGRVNLALAPGLPLRYDLYLLDETHSNPAAGGSDDLAYTATVTADPSGSLGFDLGPGSVLILKARLGHLEQGRPRLGLAAYVFQQRPTLPEGCRATTAG